LKVDNNEVLSKLRGNEFQTVGAAWQKAQLPNMI